MFKMTGNILRNLVVKQSTRRYPCEVREPFAKVRGSATVKMRTEEIMRLTRGDR